ncbi:MAG: response regulator transcription factor [Acidobacteriota bacterium]
MKALIVDDNVTMRKLIRSVTQRYFSEFRECSDGSEVLQIYREFCPDWVLMDVQMQMQDGIAATKQILAAFPDAKIVIVTAYDDADLRESARLAGAHSFLLKEKLLDIKNIIRRDVEASSRF